jgi:integral membrane sensor domain MASE1
LPTVSLPRAVLTTLALALAYYVAARLSLLLAFANTNASPVWPPSGIALVALTLIGVRAWPGVALGAFAANLMAFSVNGTLDQGSAAFASLTIAIGNTLEASAGAFLLRRWIGPDLNLNKPERIYVFAAIAAGVAAIGSLVGTTSLLACGAVPSGAGATVAAIWWLGDAAGIAIVTPFVLAWRQLPRLRRTSWRSLLLTLAGLALFGAILARVFGHTAHDAFENNLLAYLLLPAIGWAAYRYGMRGVTLLLLILSVVAVAPSMIRCLRWRCSSACVRWSAWCWQPMSKGAACAARGAAAGRSTCCTG